MPLQDISNKKFVPREEYDDFTCGRMMGMSEAGLSQSEIGRRLKDQRPKLSTGSHLRHSEVVYLH